MPLDTVSPVASVECPDFRIASRINVRMPDGGWVAPPAPTGVKVLDALERFGLPIRRSSQAIRISARWCERVSGLAEAGPSTSSLGAVERSLPPSLLMTPELDGLEIELDWDALEPQTYWIAG